MASLSLHTATTTFLGLTSCTTKSLQSAVRPIVFRAKPLLRRQFHSLSLKAAPFSATIAAAPGTRRLTVSATAATTPQSDESDVLTKIPPDNRIPATIITGFLGSGKTTLLNHILTADHGKRIAVIENEYGEVDIDGSLVAAKAAGVEDIVMLNNGCLCCTVRGDLVRMISELVNKRKGKFDHIVIETTGLANPAPIIQTFYAEDQVFNDVKLDGVVTLVDAKHVGFHLDEVKPKGVVNEAVEQIAYADRIIVNKTDLVGEPEIASLVQRIRNINRMAHLKRPKTYVWGLMSALAASASFGSTASHADGPFSFNPFSTSPPSPGGAAPASPSPSPSFPGKPPPPPDSPGNEPSSTPPKVRNDNPRTTSAGFDPEALERGAKALREINASSNAKKVFEFIKKQEETRLAELGTKAAEFKAMQAQAETERQRVVYDEQKKLAQFQAQTKSQMARYEDELARKRMQGENEYQRARNQELVKLQEESSIRQEQARRATEEQIQAQRRQTEREKAEIERETIRVRAMAEAEGRAHEAKLAEEVNRRMLVDRANAEREKWIAAINTTFDHIGGGIHAILTDQNKLVVAVGGVTALAAGVYTTREGARVIWSYVDRILGQPSLIRESSRGKYPWSGIFKRYMSNLARSADKGSSGNGKGFGDVILNCSLQKRIQQLAGATANTKSHQAPFRNMLFYGPPGTGKTMAARELANRSGLDYALMTGGDVAPLGPQAVTKIHQLFDWAKKSSRGLLLFIDEADAFLCERNKTYMSEAQRSALNALLFRTGDQSKDIVLVLATNRPGDLDSAVGDRIDEALEFPLPGEKERFKLLKLYLDKYIAQAGSRKSGWFKNLFKKQQQKIEIKGLTDDVIREAAAKTEGFSGREIAKLMASVQAAVYGSEQCMLDPNLFREVVDYKVAEHQQRRRLAGNDEPNA